MIVNGSTLLQFGLHDSLYQIKSDSVFPPHHSRVGRPDFHGCEWTFYQIQSTIINHQLLRGGERDVHFPNGFLLPFLFFRIFYYSMHPEQ